MIPNPYEQRQYGVRKKGVLSEDQGIAPLALAVSGLLSEQEAVGQPQVQAVRTNPYAYGNGSEFWNPRNAHTLGRLTNQMGPLMGGLYKMVMMRGDNPTFSGSGFDNVKQPVQTFRNYLADNLGGGWAKLNASREPMTFEELLR